jgi:DNA-binding CsgD family transcriptional regulator/tetratricopeptide (TPR) repeat protein
MELIERETLLASLDNLLGEARSGSGRLVLVAGEAGVGKTALARAFVERLPGDVRALWGACDALSTPRPLGPFLDMEPVADLIGRARGRHSLLTAMVEELSLLTVMVVEDAHWADEATLDVLRFVGRRIAGTRGLVLVTFREDEVGASHSLQTVVGDLATATGCERLAVPPLTPAGVAELATGSPLDPEHLHRVTGGNAFYVTEVLAAPGWTLPPSVADAVIARVSRLTPEAQALLEVVALSPLGLEPDLADALLPETAPALDECAEQRVLVLSGRFVTFRHELARLAVEESVPTPARRALHVRLVAALEKRSADPARLAHHADLAGDGERVLRYAPVAAREAAARGAHREAARQYERAVADAEGLPPAELAALLSAWADQRDYFDDYTEIVELRARILELRRRAGDRVGEGVALRKLARALDLSGRRTEGERTASAAKTLLEEHERGTELALTYAQLGYAAEVGYRANEALRWTSKAIDLARRVESQAALSLALNARGEIHIMFYEDAVGVSELEESRRVSLALGDDLNAVLATINLGASLMVVRQFAPALAALEEAIAFAEERDLDHFAAYARGLVAWILLEQGEWERGEALADEALGVHTTIATLAALALAVKGRIQARRGDPRSSQSLAAAWAAAREAQALSHTWLVIVGLLEAAWLANRPAEVEAVAPEAREALERIRIPWVTSELAFWLWRTGVLDRPPQGLTEPFALQVAGAWEQAGSAWRRIGCPYAEADALSEGDETAMRSALETFTRLGAEPAADRVRNRLRRAGIAGVPPRPRASTRSAPAHLTRRQLEVLALVEDGLSNAEIARRLFISEKTAGHHVSAILRKLGARTRAEAAARSRALGIAASRK